MEFTKSNKSAGSVTMSLEAYNEMRDELSVLRSAFSVKLDWDKSMQLVINLESLRPYLEDKLCNSVEFDPEKHEVVKRLYDSETTLATYKEDSEEVTEDITYI